MDNKELKMITPTQVKAVLEAARGTTFAEIETDTEVKPAAANKHRTIRKLTTANVQLFNGIKDYEIYAKAVKRSAGVEEFVQSDNYFEHTDCWSVVKHKSKDAYYLYCVYNGAKSTFTIDGVAATREAVAELLTPSAAKSLLDTTGTVHNRRNDVEHDVIVRTISLANVKKIRAQGVELTAR